MNNVAYDFYSIKRFVGTATKKTDKAIVELESIIFNSDSMHNIKNNIDKGLSNSNQSVFIPEMIIDKKDYNAFARGQTNYNPVTNSYTITGTPINHFRFECELQSTVLCNDGLTWTVQLNIKSIEFNISDSIPTISDDIVVYKNINAMIYDNCYIKLID